MDSVLKQSLPPYELIVVPNGTEEHNRRIVSAIMAKYDLVPCEPRVSKKPYVPFEDPYAFYAGLYANPHAPVRVIILCKRYGNKADALNAAMFYSTGKYVVTVDADTILDADCLRELCTAAAASRNIIAVGGLVYPVRLNPTLLSTIQLMEYETSFLIARRAFNILNCTMLLSGALSMFRKDVLNAAGGFMVNTVGEDMEVVVRLQELSRDYNTPYKITYTPKAVCFTAIPQNFSALFRQRMRWHMGLMEVMHTHRRMIFNPKHGLRGLFAMPYLLFVELLSPITTLLGIGLLIALYRVGIVSVQGILFPAVAVIAFHEAVMLLTYHLHTRHFRKKERRNGKLLCLLIGFLEMFCYRPILNLAKLKAMFRYSKYKGRWLRAR